MNEKDKLIEEIDGIKNDLESAKKMLREQAKTDSATKSGKQYVLFLQRELFEKEQEFKLTELEEMKQSLGDSKDHMYMDKKRLIGIFSDVLQKYDDLQHSNFAVKESKIDENQSNLEDNRNNLNIDYDAFNEEMKKFTKVFANYQVKYGIISEEEKDEMIEEDTFNKGDVENYFKQLSDAVYDRDNKNLNSKGAKEGKLSDIELKKNKLAQNNRKKQMELDTLKDEMGEPPEDKRTWESNDYLQKKYLIDNYSELIDEHETIKNWELTIQKMQIEGRTEEDIDRAKEQLSQKQEAFNKRNERFCKKVYTQSGSKWNH